MKRFYSLLVVVCALVGCSSVDGSTSAVESPGEQSQAATSYTTPIPYGSRSVPWSTTTFYHATYFGASGGHSQAPNWPGSTTPKYGAIFSALPPSISAFPNALATPPLQGSALTYARSNSFSEFNFGPAASQSSDSEPMRLLWGTSSGGVGVAQSVNLWAYPQSFCFIDGVQGLSTWAEEVATFVEPGTWGLYAGGVPVLSVSAKCVYPDRPWLYAAQADAYANQQVALEGLLASEGECFISRIQGDLDTGFVMLRNDLWGVWVLQTGGGVEHAQAYCIKYSN